MLARNGPDGHAGTAETPEGASAVENLLCGGANSRGWTRTSDTLINSQVL